MSGWDKKTETKRLLIYLALSFAMAWAVFFAFILTGHKWDGSSPYLESFTGLGMLAPFLAHVLTRKITREGFAMTGKDSMMMGIRLKDKKWVYFLFAVIAPWIYFEIGHALNLLAYPELFDPEGYRQLGIPGNMVFFIPVLSILQGTMFSCMAFGEESGWRGYMMPKLMKLMGTEKAVFVGGVIWGLWHGISGISLSGNLGHVHQQHLPGHCPYLYHGKVRFRLARRDHACGKQCQSQHIGDIYRYGKGKRDGG